MRVRLQNCQKRRKRLGPPQYGEEYAAYVLLSNILEEEMRMQAYMGQKKPPLMTPEEKKIGITGPQIERKEKFCAEPLLVKKYVKDFENFSRKSLPGQIRAGCGALL